MCVGPCKCYIFIFTYADTNAKQKCKMFDGTGINKNQA